MTGVYLIYRNRMFGDAVRAILGRHAEIVLLGATDDPDCVQAAVDRLAPDVILLEEASDRPPVQVQGILTNPVPCRLVTLCLDRNGMHVWSQQWRSSAGSDDLLEAIVCPKGRHASGAQRRSNGR